MNAKHPLILCLLLLLISFLLDGCVMGRVTKKTVWFMVGTTGHITIKTVEISSKTAVGVGTTATKTAVKGAVVAVDLTADAVLHVAARRESIELAKRFWVHAQGGEALEAYQLLSPAVRSHLSQQQFTGGSAWAKNINNVVVGDAVVKPHHVEVAVRLTVRTGQKLVHVSARMVTVLDKAGLWLVDGWHIG